MDCFPARVGHLVALLLLCLVALPAAGAIPFPERENRPSLTEDHRQWLDQHDELRLGIPTGRPPLAYENAFGRILGTESGYARLVERKLGIPVRMVGGSPRELEEKLARGELDALTMMSPQTWSTRQYRFTRPYMQLTYGIYARRDNASVRSLSSLDGTRIVLLDGDHYPYELLDPIPSFTPVAARTLEEAMGRLKDEEADAFLAPIPVGEQYLQDHPLGAVHRVESLDETPQSLAYAVPFDQGVVRGMLDAAISSITGQEHRNVRGAWVGMQAPVEDDEDSHRLSYEERTWLIRHPNLRIGLRSHWAPLEFVQDGVPEGLVPDLLSLIENFLGYQFERVAFEDWSEAEDMLARGELDAIAALPRTPRRQERFLFSRSYLSLPIALVVRDDYRFIGDLSELRSERVGVVRNLASQEYLRMNYPDLDVIETASNEAGLKAVSDGDLDVMVTHIPGVSYTLSQLGIDNLRITSITPYQYDLRLSVNPDRQELVGIFNRALGAINRDALDEIYNRWVHMDLDSSVDYTMVQRVILLALLVVAVFLYWNRKLSLEVDERMRSEQALRESEDALLQAKQEAETLAQRADDANRAKSEFLANMSHEIRTPMNAVMGYTELLERTLSDPRQRSYLTSIKTGSRSLLTLINDILDLSRVEAGKMRLEFGPVDLARMLDDVEHIFAIRAQEKGLTLRFDRPAELAPSLELDEARLRQVLFNLVGNAIKFTREGEVVVRARAEPSVGPERVNLTLSVSDTGIGIPVDQQQRIFDAFEQQEGQSNRQYGGTGLGLAISRKLVEMMDGQLDVHSTEGVGSVFTVRLHGVPVLREQRPGDGPESLPFHFTGGRVLVVDDNATNRQLVRDMLEPEGLVVEEAGDGQQALERARQTLPDLVLMDIRMPVLNGYRAKAAFRDDHALASVPVIALTASVMDSETHRIREAGFEGYLRKPVSRHDLLTEIARFLPHEAASERDSEASDSASPTLRPWSQLTPEVRSSITRSLEQSLKPDARSLRDSGDPEALKAFARRLATLAQEQGSQELWQLSQDLTEALDAFDLDRTATCLNAVLDWGH